MTVREKYKYLAILVFLSGFFLVLGASIVTPSPLGSDVFYHLELAEEWSRGENAMLGYFNMVHNHTPYFPVLHWLIVPSIWVGFENIFVRLLQVIFFSGTLGGLMWLVYKYVGAKASFYSGLTLLSSPAFIGDSIIQVKPSSLATLLLIPMIYFFIEDKRKEYIITSIINVYTWSFASLSFVYGLLLYKIRDRKWFYAGLVFLLLLVPFFYYVLQYSDFSAMLSRWGNEVGTLGVMMSPKLAIIQNPFFLFLYLGSPALGLFCLVWCVYKWKSLPKHTKAVCVILLSSLPLVILWVDRWVQVSSILLTFLFSDWLSRRKGFVYGFVLTFLILGFSLWMVNYWWTTWTGNWFSGGEWRSAL